MAGKVLRDEASLAKLKIPFRESAYILGLYRES